MIKIIIIIIIIIKQSRTAVNENILTEYQEKPNERLKDFTACCFFMYIIKVLHRHTLN